MTCPFQSQHSQASVKIISFFIIRWWHTGKHYLRKRQTQTHTRIWETDLGGWPYLMKPKEHDNLPWQWIWDKSELSKWKWLSFIWGPQIYGSKLLFRLVMDKINCWENSSSHKENIPLSVCEHLLTAVSVQGTLQHCLSSTPDKTGNSTKRYHHWCLLRIDNH